MPQIDGRTVLWLSYLIWFVKTTFIFCLQNTNVYQQLIGTMVVLVSGEVAALVNAVARWANVASAATRSVRLHRWTEPTLRKKMKMKVRPTRTTYALFSQTHELYLKRFTWDLKERLICLAHFYDYKVCSHNTN